MDVPPKTCLDAWTHVWQDVHNVVEMVEKLTAQHLPETSDMDVLVDMDNALKMMEARLQVAGTTCVSTAARARKKMYRRR